MRREGKQGSGKSTAVRWLAMDDKWYTELCDIRDEKAVGERLRGKWIVELGELRAFRASTEEIKSFTSRQSDRFRVGDIQRYLSDPNHDAKQVCVKQLWKEALGEPGNPTRRDCNFIAEVMDNMPGWKRGEGRITTGVYRAQLYWKKCE